MSKHARTNKTANKKEILYIIFSAVVVVLLVADLVKLSYIYGVNSGEIIAIQQEPMFNRTAIPIYEFYQINISPSYNGYVCSVIIDNRCSIVSTNSSQEDVIDLNITYFGNYTMDLYISPPEKASLKMIIDYAYNNTQNTLNFDNLSGLHIFSGKQVPSSMKLILSNGGNSSVSGYLKIIETPNQ